MAVPILKASLFMDQPPEMSARQWRQITKAALEKLAAKWHKDILPQHFTRAAPQKYRHQPRTAGYLKRKRRAAGRAGVRHMGQIVRVKYGGLIDNVFTGELERRVKQLAAIRATPTRVTLKLTGPRYMTMRRFAGNKAEAVAKGWTYGRGKKFKATGKGSGLQPDKAREITTVTEQELVLLTSFLNRSVLDRWRVWKSRRKVA